MRQIICITCLLLGFGSAAAQSGIGISNISSEIYFATDLRDGDISKLPKKVYEPKGTIQIDLSEDFYYRLRHKSFPNFSTLHFGCFIKKIEYIVKFNGELYGPYSIDDLPKICAQTQYNSTPYKLLSNQPELIEKVIKKLNTRVIDDLTIVFRAIWYTKSELDSLEDLRPVQAKSNKKNAETELKRDSSELEKARLEGDEGKQRTIEKRIKNNKLILFESERIISGEDDGFPECCLNPIAVSDKQRIDQFTMDIKYHGINVLFDFSSINNTTTSVGLDLVTGLVKNVSKTSIDYVATTYKQNSSTIMVSAPFIRYEGRGWLNKNIEAEVVLLMNKADNSKFNGFGLGIGLLGTKEKTIKTGIYWHEGRLPNYYIGLSIRGLASFLAGGNH